MNALPAALLLAALPAAAYWTAALDQPLWSLPAPPGQLRWLIIHNLATAPAEGIFHVEVLERRRSDPPWKFTRPAAHLAVTGTALRASILKPLRRGLVYPETYDAAFAQWQRERAAGHAAVCDTSIDACLAAQR